MTIKRISELPQIDTVTGEVYLPAVDPTETSYLKQNKRIKVSDFVDNYQGFTQSGSGAVSRTVTSKLRDVVSVKDFGAVGDGVANDTTAFTNARAEAKTSGKLLLVPAGNYLISGTVYGVTGPFVLSDDSFTIPINVGQQAVNNGILFVASTPNTTPFNGTDARVPVSVSVETRGAQHGECYRGNLFNKSSDGNGNPAFYAKLVNYTTSGVGWGLYGETRHNGGTSIGIGTECAGYSTSGEMIGVNVHNTTGSTPDTHPEDSSSSDAQPATSKAIQILGGSGGTDLNKWAYGLYFNPNSVQSTGIGIDFSTASCATGINCAAATFSVAPIRLGDTQNITLESTNNIKFGYNSAASGGAAIEFRNGATVNLRLYNSGIAEFLGNIRPISNDASTIGTGTRRFSEGHIRKIVLANSTNLAIQFGTGSPEGVVTGGVGSLYLRSDGGAGTSMYVKESGTGTTGWVAK